MKRMLKVLTVLCCAVAFSGCGKTESEPPAAPKSPMKSGELPLGDE